MLKLVFGWYVRRSLVFLLLGSLWACSTPSVVAPVAPPTVVNAPVDDTAARRNALVKELLFQGYDALSRDALTIPMEGSAVDFFQQVLDLDMENQLALDGIQQVGERYLQLAREAVRARDWQAAAHFLRLARRYGDEKAGSDLEQALAKRPQFAAKQQPANEIWLDEAELDRRSDTLQNTLMAAAVRAMRADSRILIVARSDAEGRWIYQQMREYLVDYRLRGNIARGADAKIVLIDVAPKAVVQ